MKTGNAKLIMPGVAFMIKPAILFPAFSTAFPLRTKQERDRFDLLRQAYVGARYNQAYKITPQQLKYLARCVELLRDQTQTTCEEKMKSFV